MKRCFASPGSTVSGNRLNPALGCVENSLYLFTCEFCFSHYVAAGVLFVVRFKLLYVDWRGYFIAFFALVWIANQYMSIYNRLRLDIKHEQVEIKADEQKVDSRKFDNRAIVDQKAA